MSIRSSGRPRNSATSSRSGMRADSIRWVVRKPSWPTIAGRQRQLGESCARSGSGRRPPVAFLAITWMKPVSSTQW
ncbi:MAG: hypothetical protein MZV65_48725 [Chromatiales bacterium]|nr:hypothetical protein [Chromatiales bacterium]